MRLIEWFARNSVAANLLMVLILASGLMTSLFITQEVFPEVSLDMITVSVEYLGASPDEVEESVCVRIEEEIQGLEGIKKVTSSASEGIGTVVIEVGLGEDVRKLLDDVKTRVDAIDTFPEETEKPVITEVTNRTQVVSVTVNGDADEATLKVLAEEIRDGLAALDGITMVELSNARPYEIAIEVSEDALRRYGITFDFVANAVRRSSLDLPGGSVKTSSGEILLRSKGQAYRGNEFEDLPLLTRPDGTHLRLGEVATVRDGFAETDQFSRFNGNPAVQIDVFRTGDQSALEIVAKVEDYLAEAQKRMPAGISLTTWNDQSRILRDRLDLLLENGRNGFILVFIVLALFLRFRLAFWVSLGIPISFLGALWLMPGLDVTINLISLFAFIVVLGIVVDDAIIVGENIHTHQKRKGRGLKAAIDGAKEVSTPVLFAVLTTIAAFMPLLNVEGTMGKFMRVIPTVVIACLLFSLVESLLILPAHLSHAGKERSPDRKKGLWYRFQSLFGNMLEWFIETIYSPFLERALRRRYITAACGLAALILTIGMVQGGWLKYFFFPDVEAEFISAAVTMPQGTPAEVTGKAVHQFERSARALQAEVDEKIFRHMSSAIGSHPYREQQKQAGPNAGVGGISASHQGEVTIELTPTETRTVSSTWLAARWRELTGDVTDAVEVNFSASIFSTGEDVNVQLTGSDTAELRTAADKLKERLVEYTGVHDVADSFREGKKELKLNITPAAELLGLTLADLARQVRQGFYGEEAQRVQRGRDDIRVMVRYPEESRRSLGDLESMRIRTPAGKEVPFSEVAVVEEGRGFASITRVDRRRSVNITADVDTEVAVPGEIVADLEANVLPRIMAEHPGLLYSFEGSQAEQRDTMAGLMRGFAIALILIYALLAVPLKSYFQPLVIMLAIPFGMVGAVWGHLIMGQDLTIMSLFGIVALAGVVVNDSLVLVDFINRHHAAGHGLRESVRRAGVARFRPILLTSLTTFAGLSPLILEESLQAKFLIPMAISLAFGVVFSTLITLVLVPAGALILEDVKRIPKWLYSRSPREETSSAVVVRDVK